MNTLVMGEFNSEKYWRKANAAKLPELSDKSSAEIILAMDELLFLFCQAGDVLITRHPFNTGLKNYLSKLGFSFYCNGEDINAYPGYNDASVFKLIAQSPDIVSDLKIHLDRQTSLLPYSVVPGIKDLMNTLGIGLESPSLEIVSKVNSKVYSCEMRNILGLSNPAMLINSTEVLLQKGKTLLFEAPFLLKDPYGVSGNGNLLITGEKILDRVTKHLKDQEQKGASIEFILEPLLKKAMDFSCGFGISKTGEINILTVQQMINRGFSYQGSLAAEEAFIQELQVKGYFEIVHRLGRKLYEDGYFGDVCLDSMQLQSGEIVPIIEINARKSMGFINHQIDRYLASFHQHSLLIGLNISYPGTLEIEDIINGLHEANILYSPGQAEGIILLTANTILINKMIDHDSNAAKTYKGRLYASVIAPDIEKRDVLLNRTKAFLEKCLCKIFN